MGDTFEVLLEEDKLKMKNLCESTFHYLRRRLKNARIFSLIKEALENEFEVDLPSKNELYEAVPKWINEKQKSQLSPDSIFEDKMQNQLVSTDSDSASRDGIQKQQVSLSLTPTEENQESSSITEFTILSYTNDNEDVDVISIYSATVRP
ncbi:uncharacterized protein BX663DRAFT_550953 [Cokeromyces recurvatus]|uniref:uncharacterized protein n=1 Tax=Cokeromyces recurvatus TaxID=90255 RepID=UPI0022206442|nr:uncharacterized protein BX663DRAFT_550953 [Cokeromyces recurvatus]KAI7903881.1 hypothetical protein BX663DRAFT_550953 [Cokeromyces recurvatus]